LFWFFQFFKFLQFIKFRPNFLSAHSYKYAEYHTVINVPMLLNCVVCSKNTTIVLATAKVLSHMVQQSVITQIL
jgi:hypothetical protein